MWHPQVGEDILPSLAITDAEGSYGKMWEIGARTEPESEVSWKSRRVRFLDKTGWVLGTWVTQLVKSPTLDFSSVLWFHSYSFPPLPCSLLNSQSQQIPSLQSSYNHYLLTEVTICQVKPLLHR